MNSLRTEGFGAVLSDVADLARKQIAVADAARIAYTLGGRITPAAGLAALRRPERALLDYLTDHDAVLDDSGIGWSLWLSATGRLTIGQSAPGEGEPDTHLIGSARFPDSATDSHRRAQWWWRREETAEREEFAGFAAQLAGEPREAVRQRLELLCHALIHMAPVCTYVGERVYSNLGGGANLPGKSLDPGAPASVLTARDRVLEAAKAVPAE